MSSKQESAIADDVFDLSSHDDGTRLTRKALLAAGVSALLLGPARRALTQSEPLEDPRAAWRAPELRLARRITQGMTWVDADEARRLGFQGYLDAQLGMPASEDAAIEAEAVRLFPTIDYGPAGLLNLPYGQAIMDLVNAMTFRAVNSRRQLYQRMVEFWTDHFNIYWEKVEPLKTPDDRHVVRAHALGKFPDMLWASAHSPGMLMYLDNDTSEGENPNENYARELLELHTMGVRGGYTQQDVREVARCFSGWRLWDTKDCMNPRAGTFYYDRRAHDDGAKEVLGVRIPAGGGQADGEIVLRILAEHPSTARHVSWKMARWLLEYDPPSRVVEAAADAYRRTGGDIPAMIRAILTPDNLMAASAKYKRPFHAVVSALRCAQATIEDYDTLSYEQYATMGHEPFGWPAPNGYPDAVGYWSALTLPRFDFYFRLLYGDLGGAQVDVKPFMKRTAMEVVAEIDRRLFGGEMSFRDREELVLFTQSAGVTEERVRDAVGLALASPGFQWY